MAFCGPGHAGAAPVQSQGKAHTADHAHHHQPSQAATDNTVHHGPGAHTEPRSRHNHAAHLAGVAAAGGHGHAQASVAVDDGASASGGAHTCSVCASCCSVGALLQAVLTVPAPEQGATAFIAEVPDVDPFAVAGPDRPPRFA